MLTAEGCAARRERLWEALPAACDLLIVGDPSHLIYFANYVPSPFVFRTVESSALLVLEPGRATLVADNLLGPFLDKAHVDEVVAPTWYDGKHAGPVPPRQARRVGARPPGEDRPASGSASSWRPSPPGWSRGSAAARPGLEIVDLGPIIRPLRRSKDADEVDDAPPVDPRRRGGARGGPGARSKPGMTELDAYLLVQNAAIEALGERGDRLRRLRLRPPDRAPTRAARRPRG